MREILVYEDYRMHRLGSSGGSQYEEVTTEKATRIDVTDVAKTKGKLLPFGRTTQDGDPSPDYPQPIGNVEGRRCRNLFTGDFSQFDNVGGEGSTYAYFKLPDDTKEYTLTLIAKNDFTPTSVTYIGFTKNGGNSNGSYRWAVAGNMSTITKGTVISLTSTSTLRYVSLFNKNEATLKLFMNNFDIQLEEGSSFTSYEPRFEGKRLELKVCNKQLFDKNNANILNTAIDANGLGNNSPTTYRTVYIPCKPNTTYTVSKLFDQTKNRFTVAYTEETPNYGVQTYGNIYNNTGYTTTITTGANAKYLVAYVWLNGGSTTPEDMINSIQIEEGTTATPNEEHKEQMIPFPLQEGQKLMEGDYLADDGVHHVREQVIYDGTEDFKKRINLEHTFQIRLRKTSSSGKCSHYRSINSSSFDVDNGIYLTYTSVLIISDLRFSTVADFKSWLATQYANGTPVTIEYVIRSEEVIDPYTPAQLESYNKLKNLLLYKGVNHIWTETDGLEPNLQLTYKRKKQSNILQVSDIQPLNNTEINNAEETLAVETPEENEVV